MSVMATDAFELGVCCKDVVGIRGCEREAIDNFATAPGVKSALTSGLGIPLPRAASSLQLRLRDDWKLPNTANMVINPTYLAQRTRSC